MPRSKGGRNDIENIVTVCGGHHRAVHHGTLVVEGGTASAIRFLHPDGREYGSVASSAAFDVRVRVFAALRGLGFRAGEVDAALAELVSDANATPTVEVLLREALLRLTPDRAQS